MPVSFMSSHVSGDFSGERIDVRIVLVDPVLAVTRQIDVYFAVPRDFHTHNDCVAAALMTLVGRIHQTAQFNFPISRRCADYLTLYYQLDDVGPVDESLEPRCPGTRLALNFSGGIDSTLLWVLLHDFMQVDFVVITSEYQHFRREHAGYVNYRRDVSCRTDLRAKHLDRHGRFNFAVPLLFAEYTDIWGIAAGHTYDHSPRSLESLRGGQRPHFLDQDPALLAGGLTEVHLMRAVFELNTAMGLVRAAPERTEAALTASGAPGTRKYALKHAVMRYAFQRDGLPLPTFLQAVQMPTVSSRAESIGWRAFWLAKRLGLEFAQEFDPRARVTDMSFIDRMQMTFLERYITNFVGLIPADLRGGLLRAFHKAGFEPFNERDYEELEFTRDLQAELGREMVTPLPDSTNLIARP